MSRIVPVRNIAIRRAQRGATLIESLLAFVVLATSTLAIVPLQGQLRHDADVTRQRAEAVRLGEEEIEGLRAFAAIAAASGVPSYDGIADADTDRSAANAAYRISRRVDASAGTGARSVAVRVQWDDRRGAAHEVALASVIARSDPAYAGALGLGDGVVTAAPRGASGRAPAVPGEARDLGDGRSAWKPAAGVTVAFLFDNASGDIVARCGVAATTASLHVTLADLSACVAYRAMTVGGTIRFTSALPPLPSVAREAPPDVGVALTMSGGAYPAAPECYSEARSAGSDRYVVWHCVVVPRAGGRWSGRADVVALAGWTIGSTSADRRVCRYAHDADGSGAIDGNAEHPAAYVDVGAPLQAQSFLVVRGDATCPGSPAVRLTGEGAVVHADLGTQPHQP